MIASNAEFDGRFRNHNNNKVMPSSKRFFESENVYMVLNGQTGECRELQFFFFCLSLFVFFLYSRAARNFTN